MSGGGLTWKEDALLAEGPVAV
ncbi:protein of unknown function (plasmid) [Cupriavidus taiwanensis]|uniref:Uncharacterized protein n=1 Tax=Cupriavidus taiwanensis TaxID=164546 RepID=A0A9Q7V0J5_9BURK|nr:protein of unknown function [Cupriavidus taiwanensis]